jgi:hypothetical protein
LEFHLSFIIYPKHQGSLELEDRRIRKIIIYPKHQGSLELEELEKLEKLGSQIFVS